MREENGTDEAQEVSINGCAVSTEGSEVRSPSHYVLPSGVECRLFTDRMSFNLGNAFKYLWRAGRKGGPEKELLDIRKSRESLEMHLESVHHCLDTRGSIEPCLSPRTISCLEKRVLPYYDEARGAVLMDLWTENAIPLGGWTAKRASFLLHQILEAMEEKEALPPCTTVNEWLVRNGREPLKGEDFTLNEEGKVPLLRSAVGELVAAELHRGGYASSGLGQETIWRTVARMEMLTKGVPQELLSPAWWGEL